MEEVRLLWFEDNYEKDFIEISENLKKHCLKNHKILVIEPYPNYPLDFDVQLFEGVYSFAFIDLNLDTGQKGTEIVGKIREYGSYIDILMYSNNPKQLVELTEGKNYVENVFRHATYRGLEQKMKDVIDQVLYKEMMVMNRFEDYQKLLKKS